MNWGSWDAFWAMGGYAQYVWGAYGVLALAVLLETTTLAQHLRRARRRARSAAGAPAPAAAPRPRVVAPPPD